MGIKVIQVLEEGRLNGPAFRVTAVAEKLRKQGHEVIVVSSKENGEAFQQLLNQKHIPSHFISISRLSIKPFHLFKYIATFLRDLLLLTSLFKREKPDLVHCNGSYQLKGVIAAKWAGVPAVWHMNDAKMQILVRKVMKLTAIYSKNYFVSASYITERYYKPYSVKANKFIGVIPAPVDVTRFDPKKTASYLLSNEPDSDFKIVTVANINPIKGLENIIKAAAILQEKDIPSISFHIFGPIYDSQKQFHKSLETLKAELGVTNVYFEGGTKDVPSVLKAADIYCCSSYSESSPMAVWEALAMECFVVSTEVGDIKTIFAEDECGIVVPEKTGDAIAQGILDALELTKAQRDEVRARARQTAIKRFSLEHCVQRHIEVYEQIVQETQNSGIEK
ncbi:MAG: glycosyltransferase [Bacteroidota bacterium]